MFVKICFLIKRFYCMTANSKYSDYHTLGNVFNHGCKFLWSKLTGKEVSWEGRKIFHQTFCLLAKKERTNAEVSRLNKLLSHCLDHQEDFEFWRSKIKFKEYNDLDCLVDKLFKAMHFMESYHSTELVNLKEEVNRLNNTGKTLINNFKVSALAISTFKYQETLNYINNYQINLMESERLKKIHQSISPIIGDSTQLVERTLKNAWNARHLAFMTVEAKRIFHPNNSGLVNEIFHKTGTRYHHAVMVLNEKNRLEQAHMGYKNFEVRSMPIPAFLTSDILELDAAKMLPADSEVLVLLQQLWNKTKEEVIHEINFMLENAIKESHRAASNLDIRNWANSVRVIMSKLQNLFLRPHSKVSRAANFRKGQSVHCSEYVLLTAFRAIEQVNAQLSAVCHTESRILLNKIPTDKNPGAFRPDEVYQFLKPMSQVIQGAQ